MPIGALMLSLPSDPRSAAATREGGSPLLESVPTEDDAASDREGEENGTPYVSPPIEKGWGLKLAVLLVVAVLCIAFAGLLWALIF